MIFDENTNLEELTPLIAPFLYREEITIIAGGPYAGKSRFSLKIAIKLAKGEETFLGKQPPLKILYCSERSWKFNSSQLRTVGITENLPTNFKMFCIKNLSYNEKLKFQIDPLEYIALHYLNNGWKPDIMILDTLPHFQGIVARKDINSYAANRDDLLRISSWAAEHNISIWAVTHSPKQPEKNKHEDPFEKVIGSVAILAATVSAAILERVNDEYIRIHFKSHAGAMDSPRFFTYADYTEVSDIETTAAPIQADKLSKQQYEVLQQIPTEWTDFHKLRHDLSIVLSLSDNHLRNIFNVLVKRNQVMIDALAPQGKLIRRFESEELSRPITVN